MNRRILLVEDEPTLCEMLAKHLTAAGYVVTAFNRGDEALVRLLEDPPDLAVLDIQVPGTDGLSLLRSIRERDNLPVIFISARKSELDRVLGIELGADDYLVKPFSSRELVARVRALFRRVDRERSPGLWSARTRALQSRRLSLDLDRLRLSCGNTAIELTQSEFLVLGRLMSQAGLVVPRSQLLEDEEDERPSDSRAVDVHIKNLRRKLESLGVVAVIETIRGVGYRFED